MFTPVDKESPSSAALIEGFFDKILIAASSALHAHRGVFPVNIGKFYEPLTGDEGIGATLAALESYIPEFAAQLNGSTLPVKADRVWPSSPLNFWVVKTHEEKQGGEVLTTEYSLFVSTLDQCPRSGEGHTVCRCNCTWVE